MLRGALAFPTKESRKAGKELGFQGRGQLPKMPCAGNRPKGGSLEWVVKGKFDECERGTMRNNTG